MAPPAARVKPVGARGIHPSVKQDFRNGVFMFIVALLVVGLGGLFSFDRSDDRNDRTNECGCGWRRTCPFGPGVVGEQQCETDPLMVNRWSRCEPVSK